MLPTVTDHCIANYAKRVLGENIDLTRAELSDGGREIVSDLRILHTIFGLNETEKFRSLIASLCELDFEPPGQGQVMILTDRCNFYMRGAVVKTCLRKDQWVNDPVTVVERTTGGRGLGRMAIQPPPISYQEMAEGQERVAAHARQMMNGRHP